MDANTIILKLSCPDSVGLLARISGFIAGGGGNLIEVHQYTDPLSRWFFTRMQIEPSREQSDIDALTEAFRPLAKELNADWTLRWADAPVKMVVFASKEEHCLAELLWRKRCGELCVEIPMVIANHATCAGLVQAEEIPFEHMAVSLEDKEAAFRRMAELCDGCGAELIVLARFMQVLPEWFCAKYEGRIINIHHSFLPAFAGADPYRRAFERGVKLIGATCHYATSELDAGPIIEQEVIRVEHFHDIADLKRVGRDCERMALARGVRFHVEDRVLIHGPRAIVFRD